MSVYSEPSCVAALGKVAQVVAAVCPCRRTDTGRRGAVGSALSAAAPRLPRGHQN